MKSIIYIGWPEDLSKMDAQTWNFAQGVLSACPTHSYKKISKNFPSTQNVNFWYLKNVSNKFNESMFKDAEFNSY